MCMVRLFVGGSRIKITTQQKWSITVFPGYFIPLSNCAFMYRGELIGAEYVQKRKASDNVSNSWFDSFMVMAFSTAKSTFSTKSANAFLTRSNTPPDLRPNQESLIAGVMKLVKLENTPGLNSSTNVSVRHTRSNLLMYFMNSASFIFVVNPHILYDKNETVFTLTALVGPWPLSYLRNVFLCPPRFLAFWDVLSSCPFGVPGLDDCLDSHASKVDDLRPLERALASCRVNLGENGDGDLGMKLACDDSVPLWASVD